MIMDAQNMSKSVYVGMCREIGTPQQVASRRDIVDIWELLLNNSIKSKYKQMRRGGSYREGFRLRGSDIDTMYWPTNYRVIWDISQSEFYNTHRNKMILCDSSENPPGFTLLWLPLKQADSSVLSACVKMKGGLYISSSKYRKLMQCSIRPDATEHGPCTSGTYGRTEFDEAHSFISDFWPPSASSWIDRCHSWPSPHVVSEILRNGCHFVAIGQKTGDHLDNEWRISFSLAEHKIVYSMNHTQFLTYGLLKLFLKEIVNNRLRDNEKLLCSYYMKTVVFWVFQLNTLRNWCPQNLLVGFWVCFKLLLKWVYEGVCPNFFIPQNNMFLGKIHGHAQANLFTRLYELYEKGIGLLIHSPSIRSSFTNGLCNPRRIVCTDEQSLISEAEFDVQFFEEVDKNDAIHTSDLHDLMKFLYTVEQLIGSPLTQYQVVLLQKYTATILQCTAFILHNMQTHAGVNKQLYVAHKMHCHMLNLAAKFGYVSDTLYIVMYYYKTLRYREALSVIEKTKVSVAQPYLMYREHVNKMKYTEAVRGQSLSKKMRHAIAADIRFDNEICYINELILDQQSSTQNSESYLNIPPYVLLHMLEFLCCRYVDTKRAQSVLDELKTLVHYDPGQLVPVELRDISWEILGICQQITGNVQDALYSYQQSLRRYSILHKIQDATRQRIHDLQS